MIIKNGQKIHQTWLVYSFNTDSVFFCVQTFWETWQCTYQRGFQKLEESGWTSKGAWIFQNTHHLYDSYWSDERGFDAPWDAAVERCHTQSDCHNMSPSWKSSHEWTFEEDSKQQIKGVKSKMKSALIGDKVIDEIVKTVKKARCFSVIMDCTPGISHADQLSIVFRVVNREPLVGASISEYFIGLVYVEDTFRS